jgi:hypothetical protein
MLKFNLGLTQHYFPAVLKEAAIVPVFEIGYHATVSNYRHVVPFSVTSLLFGFIIHDLFLHYVKLSPNKYDFTKFKSTVTNLVTFLDFVTPVLRGQPQADAVILIFQMLLT